MKQREWTKDVDKMEFRSQLCYFPGVFCGHVTYLYFQSLRFTVSKVVLGGATSEFSGKKGLT